ncbi:MAG: hypothetical protein ABI168_00405 [Ginsengibacter sp.]
MRNWINVIGPAQNRVSTLKCYSDTFFENKVGTDRTYGDTGVSPHATAFSVNDRQTLLFFIIITFQGKHSLS